MFLFKKFNFEILFKKTCFLINILTLTKSNSRNSQWIKIWHFLQSIKSFEKGRVAKYSFLCAVHIFIPTQKLFLVKSLSSASLYTPYRLRQKWDIKQMSKSLIMQFNNVISLFPLQLCHKYTPLTSFQLSAIWYCTLLNVTYQKRNDKRKVESIYLI